jgi:tyrosine-protein kinase Etk/Wzc
MTNDDSYQLAGSGGKDQPDSGQDLKKIYSLVFTNWYYFLIALIITLICAFLYIKYTTPVYRVSATLLIDEENRGGAMGNNQIFEGFGLGSGAKNLDNQIAILSSKTLIDRTIDELNFDIEYYYRNLFDNVSLYPYPPVRVLPEIADSLPRDIEFKLKYLDNNMFSIFGKAGDSLKLDTITSFNRKIKFSENQFAIEKINDSWPSRKNEQKVYFINHDRKKLVESYKDRIKVESASKKGTVVNINLVGPNKAKDIIFLDKLTEIFLNNSLDKKNQEAIRTIQFIDDQLIGISDSLVITENKLQQFRSSHRVMDLSAQGQVIIDQAMSLENEKARLGIEANYYNYLADYLEKDNVGQAPIAPATMGITDPGLTRLVSDLTDLQSQLYSKSLGEKNPLQAQLSQRVRNTKGALKETLNGVIRANNLAMNEINEQIRTVNAQAAALPVTERQLLGIERKYKLNDELYTFLLEKRAEAQIQKASNMPDNELVDPSDTDSNPVKPKTALIYLIALLAGFGFPFVWITIADTFNRKVHKVEDIKKITDIPIAAHIPHSPYRKNKIIFEEPSSDTAEAFRSLRSKMQFFTKEVKTPVILVTSSIPEEGKTFTAINLASSYSLIGKKTILVGFDLRKPKIYTDFGLGNDKGVSTWLNGKDGFEDIVKKTSHENLFIIPAGPVPPNPSELAVLGKTEELLRLLKERFDCIIIDSSPIGTVSDSFHLASLSDTCILIVKQNLTTEDLLETTANEIKIRDIRSVSIVVNDVGPEFRQYGYFNKYSDSYGKSNIKG